MVNIAVVGAGAPGLSSALALQTLGQVTLIAHKFSPDTTSNVAAGLWGPHVISGDQDLIYKWAKSTHDFLERCWRSEHSSEYGVSLVSVCNLSSAKGSPPFWKDIPYGFRELSENELQEISSGRNLSKPLVSGHEYITFVCEGDKLLPTLMEEFLQNGGVVEERVVESLEELVDTYHIVVNCCGLGSRELCRDDQIYPVRGQVLQVHTPWLKRRHNLDSFVVIPQISGCIMGHSKHVPGDSNMEPTVQDTDYIQTGVNKWIPSTRGVCVDGIKVGLRPCRRPLRLETEKLGRGSVIHNYGHGGAGLTTFWGCAREVTRLARETLLQIHSKL